MLLDMAGRRPILMLCTILLVLIKCIDTQNASSPPNSHPPTTSIPLKPISVTHATDTLGPASISGESNSSRTDNQSSPLASTTATLTPTPVTRSNSTELEKSKNSSYSNASTSHPASTMPSKPALRPSATPASSATASSPATLHPLTTYIPLIPTTVTHATDAQNASSPPNSHPPTTSIPLSRNTVTHATASSPPTSHPLTTSIPLNPTTVTHATDSSPPTSHPLTASIPLNPTTTTVTHATAPSQSPPGCGYTITKIPFGFEIFTGASGSYTIEYQDDQNRSTNVMFNGSSHKIMKLCYNYTAIKVLDGTSSCSLTGDNIFSYNDSGLLKIEFNSSIRKVCHNAIWNTSDVTFKVNNVSVKGSCRRIEQTEFCSNVTATITSAECQFSKTETIEIIPTLKDIQLKQSGTWPVDIIQPIQLQCIEVVNYTCNGTVRLQDLKPFQKYSCSGEVLYKNKTIPSPNTKELTIDTNCDVRIMLTGTTITNTSAHFKWNVHSSECPKLTEQEYKNECEYVCAYNTIPTNENKYQSVENKSPECALTNLMPFTKYNFVLKLRCYGNDVKGSKLERAHMTEPGIPEGKIIVRTKSISSNGFEITCAFNGKLNGKIEQYSAKMIDQHNSIQEEKEKKNICEFEFTGLSYSTTYYLTVRFYNGKFWSSPSARIPLSAGSVKEGTHMTKMGVEFCLANNPSTT